MPLGWLIIGLIRIYQLTLSPMLGARCRFHPSCSAYALQAVRVHGPAKGTLLAALRLGRCHPWHPGGLDPIPPRRGWRPDIHPDGRSRIPTEDLRLSPVRDSGSSMTSGVRSVHP